MVKVKLGDELIQSKIRFKVRFDFKGEYRPGRFFFGGKTIEQSAIDKREEKIALMKNIPLQGVTLEDYDLSLEPYVLFDETLGERVAYAPAIIVMSADTIEDIVRFVMREEYRTMEVLEPTQMILTNVDLERVFFKMNEELKNQLLLMYRKLKR